MRRPFSAYLLAVLLPCTLAVGATLLRIRTSWQEARFASDARVARMTLQLFQQDLGQAVASLTDRAEPAEMDAGAPTVQRVLSGDTVTGLRTSGPVPELFVLAPPRPGDPPDRPRLASERLKPSAPKQVGTATGYDVALYLGGRRWAATDGGAAPDSLDDATVQALGAAPGGLSLGSDRGGGAVVVLGRGAGAIRGMAAWAAPGAPVPGPLPFSVLLVTGLLLFSAPAGWLLLSARRGGSGMRPLHVLVLALVPALTAWGFEIQGRRHFRDALGAMTVADLTRGLAVAGARQVTAFPRTVRELTGFDATVIRDGEVRASSLAAPGPAIASIPLPPDSATASGRMVTTSGLSAYVARRTPDGATVVLTAPEPVSRIEEVDRRLSTIGIALATWLVMAGVFLSLRRRGSGS